MNSSIQEIKEIIGTEVNKMQCSVFMHDDRYMERADVINRLNIMKSNIEKKIMILENEKNDKMVDSEIEKTICKIITQSRDRQEIYDRLGDWEIDPNIAEPYILEYESLKIN